MEYVAHFFEHLTDTLRPLHSVNLPGESLEDARAAAIVLLPTINRAMGFRICDRTDRQLDIYVPPDSIAPGS